MPLIPLLTVRFGHGVWRTFRQLRPRLGQGLEQLLALGLFLMGAAVYLYWQTGEGLLPGKDSTVKFLYFAYHYRGRLASARGLPVAWRANSTS